MDSADHSYADNSVLSCCHAAKNHKISSGDGNDIIVGVCLLSAGVSDTGRNNGTFPETVQPLFTTDVPFERLCTGVNKNDTGFCIERPQPRYDYTGEFHSGYTDCTGNQQVYSG